MFTLAHMSDIHLGPLPKVRKRDLISKRITGYINWQRSRGKAMGGGWLKALVEDMQAREPDHIAVTGDLVNLALAAEVQAARGWLETVGPPDRVSVVPGNHDAYVPGALARVRDAWAPYMAGDRHPDTDRPSFPYLRRRGSSGAQVAIIGVNSGRATAPFMSTGSYRSEQDNEAQALLKATRDAFRVVLIHHPPFEDATNYSKRLIGSRRFRKALLRQGADLVLHGHTHIESIEAIEGPGRDIPVIGVPSASTAPDTGGSKPPGRYNLFEIDGEPDSWICRMRQFGYEPGGSQVVELATTHELHS